MRRQHPHRQQTLTPKVVSDCPRRTIWQVSLLVEKVIGCQRKQDGYRLVCVRLQVPLEPSQRSSVIRRRQITETFTHDFPHHFPNTSSPPLNSKKNGYFRSYPEWIVSPFATCCCTFFLSSHNMHQKQHVRTTLT